MSRRRSLATAPQTGTVVRITAQKQRPTKVIDGTVVAIGPARIAPPTVAEAMSFREPMFEFDSKPFTQLLEKFDADVASTLDKIDDTIVALGIDKQRQWDKRRRRALIAAYATEAYPQIAAVPYAASCEA